MELPIETAGETGTAFLKRKFPGDRGKRWILENIFNVFQLFSNLRE